MEVFDFASVWMGTFMNFIKMDGWYFAKPVVINTLKPRWNGLHFADNIFKRIFFNENVWISIKISLKFVPGDQINNILALVQIMAWRRPGDKPLSEPVMISLPTYICFTGPQWVKLLVMEENLSALSSIWLNHTGMFIRWFKVVAPRDETEPHKCWVGIWEKLYISHPIVSNFTG